jgi:hypothetical protein
MRVGQIRAIVVAFFLTLGPAIPLFSQDRLEISEFLAINDRGLDDEDRDEEDWIEIHNAGSGPANLEGWYLTDRADNLTMWQFPSVIIEADGYLVVFASGKDRRDPAGTLHTNFRLSGAGEYLALVHPDGVTVASAFAPTFPVQAPDVSYGLSGATTETVLLASGAPARAFVPPNGSLEQRLLPDDPRPWTREDFDDSYWPAGKTGVGFGYAGQIGLDVSAMRGVNETVYVRIPFVVEDPSVIRSLTLRMRFNDGMIAYINGREVARDNAPELETETWNSGATASWPNSRTVPPKDFPIRRFDFLHVGTNVLAIQGLNFGLTSADLLVHPELIAAVAETEPLYRYFPAPTPGRPNDAGVEVLGPIIRDPDYHPKTVTVRDGIQITARIAPSFAPVASARLHYRVMFNAEVTVSLLDDGKSGDEGAGDGIYGARIPSGGFTPGQMVRWYLTATDSAGRVSRYPAYLDPLNSPQYCGTVVADPSLTSPLPVLHWFIENPNAANSDTGTRCAIAYGGEFYDNIWINLHGQSSRGFPKKSYDIDFNRGHNFRWAPGQPRVGDINLMTTFPDKAQMRNILAYDTYRDAGCVYHWVFAVRVQQNAAFWGTAHLMENGDKDWLIRLGANTEGALYKMYNTFTEAGHATTGAEKKTRKHEDNADLLALFQGLSLSGDALRRYLYDNVDIAQVVNFLATRAMTGDTDCCHKNYYFYRDTGRSNEWQMWPWDVDLSFGRRWNSAQTYWNHVLDVATPLFTGNNNRLPQSIFNTPELRQMYLRRVRTLMDELLKPGPTAVIKPAPSPTPGPTPRPRNVAAVVPLYSVAADAGATQYYEPRIDELAAQIAADAALDNAKWNSHAWGNGSTAPSYPQPYPDAVAELRDSYLPERRRQLFDRLISGASELPNAQPAGTVLLFGATDTKPLSGNLNEQYIQLLNPNAFAVDISGWSLTLGSDAPRQIFPFRGGTVIPASGTLYVAANRVAFRARRFPPTGGEALFIVGDFTGPLATAGETLELTDRQGAKVASTVTRSSSR